MRTTSSPSAPPSKATVVRVRVPPSVSDRLDVVGTWLAGSALPQYLMSAMLELALAVAVAGIFYRLRVL